MEGFMIFLGKVSKGRSKHPQPIMELDPELKNRFGVMSNTQGMKRNFLRPGDEQQQNNPPLNLDPFWETICD